MQFFNPEYLSPQFQNLPEGEKIDRLARCVVYLRRLYPGGTHVHFMNGTDEFFGFVHGCHQTNSLIVKLSEESLKKYEETPYMTGNYDCMMIRVWPSDPITLTTEAAPQIITQVGPVKIYNKITGEDVKTLMNL